MMLLGLWKTLMKIYVKQIDLYGQEDGFSYISINDITKISYDSEDERIIMRLYES